MLRRFCVRPANTTPKLLSSPTLGHHYPGAGAPEGLVLAPRLPAPLPLVSFVFLRPLLATFFVAPLSPGACRLGKFPPTKPPRGQAQGGEGRRRRRRERRRRRRRRNSQGSVRGVIRSAGGPHASRRTPTKRTPKRSRRREKSPPRMAVRYTFKPRGATP